MSPEEKSFRAAIRRRPGCVASLCAYADWLREHDDPRADGYWVLAIWRRWPRHGGCRPGGWVKRLRGCWEWWFSSRKIMWSACCERLPGSWLRRLRGGVPYRLIREDPSSKLMSYDYETMLDALDGAAMAFARLPQKVRDRLLAGPQQKKRKVTTCKA